MKKLGLGVSVPNIPMPVKVRKNYMSYIRKSVRRLICILKCAKDFKVKFNYRNLDLQQLSQQLQKKRFWYAEVEDEHFSYESNKKSQLIANMMGLIDIE